VARIPRGALRHRRAGRDRLKRILPGTHGVSVRSVKCSCPNP
jgi:hypothetical protein